MRTLPLGLAVLLAVCAASGALASPAAGPVNASPPTITGDVKVGGTVSASPGIWASSSGSISFAYAWQTCDAKGNSCQPLPYATQTVTDLRAAVGSTIRVVVTATDASGSTTAGSTPVTVRGAAGTTSIALVRPKNGSVVHTRNVKISLRVTSSGAIRSVTVDGFKAKLGAGGLWIVTELVEPGKKTIQVGADDGFAGAHKAFTFTDIPRVAAIQGFNSPGGLTAPGCTTCSIRDARGDDRGAPPDIKSVAATFKKGWVVMTFVTYGSVSHGHGGHPCVYGITRPGPHQVGFDAGCFEGPHVGMIFGMVCGSRVDANGDCGSAHMSFPNGHTTVYRFRPSQIGNPSSFFWQAWVLYPGDQVKDTVPNQIVLGNGPGLNCWVKQQLRSQRASSYGWGRNPCRQTGVVTAH